MFLNYFIINMKMFNLTYFTISCRMQPPFLPAVYSIPKGVNVPSSDSKAKVISSNSFAWVLLYPMKPSRPVSSAVQSTALRRSEWYSDFFHFVKECPYLSVRLGFKLRLFKITKEYHEMNAPPPSSIAPTPTSQLSMWPDTITAFCGNWVPLSSATTFLETLSGKFSVTILSLILMVSPLFWKKTICFICGPWDIYIELNERDNHNGKSAKYFQHMSQLNKVRRLPKNLKCILLSVNSKADRRQCKNYKKL